MTADHTILESSATSKGNCMSVQFIFQLFLARMENIAAADALRFAVANLVKHEERKQSCKTTLINARSHQESRTFSYT